MKRYGFTLIEIAIALVVLGLLLVPLAGLTASARAKQQQQKTAQALQDAKDALLIYAAKHQGCLPQAADFEGGVIDTDATGAATHSDTGIANTATMQRAGDIPWADLQLTARGETNGLRLQYYVASPFTAFMATNCPARIRNTLENWRDNVTYQQGDVITHNGKIYVAESTTTATPPSAPWALFANGTISAWNEGTTYNIGDYISSGDKIYRALTGTTAEQPALSPAAWRQIGLPGYGEIPVWQSYTSEGYRRGEIVTYNNHLYRAIMQTTSSAFTPDTSISWEDLSLPPRLLETRMGPDVENTPGSTIVSNQNVFVLIAPGDGNSTIYSRTGMRDETHINCPDNTPCTAWATLNDANVDSRIFSQTARDAKMGDIVLPVSFIEYQAALAKFGLIVTGWSY